MSERQLSIHEIDDLMSIFKGGRRVSDRLGGVESVDLNNPIRIPKGIIETLAIRHEQAARGIAQSFRTALRKDLSLSLVALEQELFGTFVGGLEEPCCVFVVEMAPLRQPAHLVLDHALAFACLDRILGGPGDGSGASRELTATEVAVLMEVVQPVLAAHVQVWQRFTNLTPKLLRTVSVPRFLRDMRTTDSVLVANYRFAGFAEDSRMRLAMPLPGLDSHLQYARRDTPELPSDKRAQSRGRVLQHLGAVTVGVSVGLGKSSLSVRDILALRRGDVIVLDRKVNETLDLRVEGRSKFRGYLHRLGRHLLFRVTQQVEPVSRG